MTQLIAIVEGQTELEFVKQILYNHLWPKGIFVRPLLVSTKIKGPVTLTKGGVVKYILARKDILSGLNQNDKPYVTTMIDYYGLPKSYPGMDSVPNGTCNNKVEFLEQQIADDINHRRFIPYLQLHEFEAILFASPEKICDTLIQSDKLQEVQKVRDTFNNPEEINDNPQTCPSRRIKNIFPEYNKVVYGPLISQRIGLSIIRENCPHFNQWLTKLESIQ